MKLLEALEILKRPSSEATSTWQLFLLCGFTPLHLKTFLAAHLRVCFPTSCTEIKTGLYGDLLGNLKRLQPSTSSAACVAVEWYDLDPRLGIRSLGGWRSTDISDIVESAGRQSERLAHLIKQRAEIEPVYVSTPTLPLLPMFATKSSQAHNGECKLREMAASLATSLSASRQIKLVNMQLLDELSPLAQRFDTKSEVGSGFPYSLQHASRLAELFAILIQDTPSKKGLITDLDDTLWAGIVGEIGVEAIAWDISEGAQVHGLYQRFLESLATTGVLLAAASKNDPRLVEQALTRKDILLPRDMLFPLEVGWGPKSKSVRRILERWNIAPDDVVFVDDSPMEVAEVQAAFPQMTCVVFPRGDHQAILDFFKRLRDIFGKSSVSTEDEIRLGSIRSSAALQDSLQAPGTDAESFLREAEATIFFAQTADVRDNRAFELINKTNQFNLNGRRLSRSDWVNFLRTPGNFLLTATYKDRYGPLGKIAVVMGTSNGSRLHVCSWVMSCRAFSRRIEHQCLKYLFENIGVEEVVFDFEPTPRNGPIQEFFAELLGYRPLPGLSIRKASFDAKTPALFHRIVQSIDVPSARVPVSPL
jgi:FkbH-like protein